MLDIGKQVAQNCYFWEKGNNVILDYLPADNSRPETQGEITQVEVSNLTESRKQWLVFLEGELDFCWIGYSKLERAAEICLRFLMKSLSKYRFMHSWGETTWDWIRTISEEIRIIKEP